MTKLLKYMCFLATIVLLIGVTASAQASLFLGDIYVSGQENLFEDQDREAFVDVNNDDRFSVGDVLVGFARIDDHSAPLGAFGALGNRVHAIFTQEVAAINVDGSAFDVIFKPTTVAGLTLSDLTQTAVNPNSIIALYGNSTPLVPDLINVSPGQIAPTSPTVNIFDYFQAIIDHGVLNFTAGIGNVGGAVGLLGPTAALPDYFKADTSPAGSALIVGSVAAMSTLSTSIGIGSFSSGMSVLDNFDPDVVYNKAVQATESFPSLHQFVIVNGNIQGSRGAVNSSQWDNINPDLGFSNPGGFITNADFVINATTIPEPSAFIVWGLLSAVGILGTRRPQRKALNS